MRKITVSAPGKVHLLGEHVVVYGKPALLTAINKRVTVTVQEIKEPHIEVRSKEFDTHMSITPDIVIERTRLARKAWEDYHQTHTLETVRQLLADPLNFPVIVIGETLLAYDKHLSHGFSLEISCDIPIGSGMGSSAAMAVAIAGGVTRFLGEPFDKERINAIAFNAEKIVHGTPSGGDNATCTYGGMVWFRRETPDLRIIKPLPFSLSPLIAEKFLVILTGSPEETTGEMIAYVREAYKAQRHKVQEIMDNQEMLTRDLVGAFQTDSTEKIKHILKAGEANLEALGVVSPIAQQYIRQIEAAGGVAKISGAGGKAKASGILLAFHEDRNILQNLLQSHGLSYSSIKVGEEGVRED